MYEPPWSAAPRPVEIERPKSSEAEENCGADAWDATTPIKPKTQTAATVAAVATSRFGVVVDLELWAPNVAVLPALARSEQRDVQVTAASRSYICRQRSEEPQH